MTLESQYNQFLFLNPGADLSFSEWKKIHARILKQHLIDMMKDDEELGLYDEPFRHKVEIIPAEEILANRSNAYEFIDFDKQETLNEVALEFAKDHHEMYETSNLGSMHFGFCWGAKWQAERSYSEEEVIDIAKQAFVLGKDFGLIGTFKEWFDTVKKK